MQNETKLTIFCVLSCLIGVHRYVLHFICGLTVFVVSGPLIWRDSPAVVPHTFFLSTWHNTDSHWQPATFLGNHRNCFQSLWCSVIFWFCWRSMCSEMLKRRDQRQRDLFAKCLTGCSFCISCSLFPIVCVGALPLPARVSVPVSMSVLWTPTDDWVQCARAHCFSITLPTKDSMSFWKKL